jgi:hypothetical protein
MTSNQTPYPCPCCGHRTLNCTPPSTWEICPVCYWENAALAKPDLGGHDEDDFLRAQASYADIGASRVECLQLVRPPLPHEIRDASWQTLAVRRESACQEIEQMIRRTFATESIQRYGVSLHQMDDVDANIADGPAWDAHRKMDPECRWWEVTDEKLYKFGESLTFLDAAGYAFYIPAYLSLACRQLRQRALRLDYWNEHRWQEAGWLANLWGLWNSLEARPYYVEGHYSAVDANQRRAIACFLQVFTDMGTPYQRPMAQKYLDDYWAQYLPRSTTAMPTSA